MVDYGELPEPEDNSEENSALLFRYQVVPTVHRLSNAIEIEVDALSQLLDGLVTALVFLELLPENALEGNPKSTSYLNH